MTDQNALGQPIGPKVAFTPPPRPERAAMAGQYCVLEPLRPDHGPGLFDALSQDQDGAVWTYMPNGPFADLAAYVDWLRGAVALDDPLQFAIVVGGRPLGTASLLRISPQDGSVEVGYITFSPALQRTRAATEAMFLLMRWAFTVGYRRYEWKCNALNAPSRRAAMRLGLSFEGVFRQATVVKGRNRDTAWYAAIDSDWPALEAAFRAWLAPENFDDAGQQKQSLSALTRPILTMTG